MEQKNNIITPKPIKLNVKPATWLFKYRAGDKDRNKRGYTLEQLKDEANDISQTMYEKGMKKGGIQIIYHYPGRRYASYITRTGHEVDTVSHSYEYENEEEPDYFDGFDIYVYTDIYTEEGGCSGKFDKDNDCLYNCLLSIIGQPFFRRCYTAKQFKDELGIKRQDKININKLKDVEILLNKKVRLSHGIPYEGKYRLNVMTNDIKTSYISKLDEKKYKMEINLKLRNDHYEIDYLKSPIKLIKISKTERTPLFYKTEFSNNEFKTVCYDPEQKKERLLANEEFKTIRNRMYDKKINESVKNYYLLPIDKTKGRKENINKKLIDYYNEYITMADKFKSIKFYIDNTTNIEKEAESKKTRQGININYYKTGTDKLTALSLFGKLSRMIIPEPLSQFEELIYNNAGNGGLMYFKQYKGKVFEYDLISAYPSAYSSSKLYLPYKKGENKTYKELPQKLPYGLYRCEIMGTNKLFKKSYHDEYTHMDIERARQLKLEVNIIQDDKPNAVIYTVDKMVVGSQLFGAYVKYLYELKEKGIKKAKNLLNIVWGALCEVNKFNKKISNDRPIFDCSRKHIISTIHIRDDLFIMKYTDPDKPLFKTNWARIGCFIRSYVRNKLSRMIEPYINDIVYINTDGFYSTTKLNIKTGSKIGDLRIKAVKEVEINNFRPKVLSEKKL